MWGAAPLLAQILLVWYQLGAAIAAMRTSSGKLIRTPGDIVFGGIFPMHEHDPDRRPSTCGAVKEEKGVQRLEAMLYAIDALNADQNILPNVTIGALILDSCSSAPYALEQSMEFVRSYMNQDLSEYRCSSGGSPVFVPHMPVTGVIGASFSVNSIMVANILRLFKIPQISYASTSTELSDKSRFGYFSRVVPPDNFQAQAMVDVVLKLGWKYVSTVAVEGDYGERGIQSFVQLASKTGICVGVSEMIHRKPQFGDYDRVVQRLLERKRARAVVMFVDEDNIRKLLAAAVRANVTGHFLYVASDSWGAKNYPVRDQEFAAEGAITILPRRTSIPEFDQYYLSLRPRLDSVEGNASCDAKDGTPVHPKDPNLRINCRNVWFREFWEQHHNCSFSGPSNCSGEEKLVNYEQEGLVPFVVDAVYALAMAIHNMILDTCGRPFNLCDAVKPAPRGDILLEYIRNVSFRGRQDLEVRFNKDGDAFGSYHIYQYQKHGNRFDYTLIGSWEESLKINLSRTQWRDETGSHRTNAIPASLCSDECPIGHIRNYQDTCCWGCVPCAEYSYVLNDTCKPCGFGMAPEKTRTSCYKVKPSVLGWASPWAYIPLGCSALGVAAAVFTIAVFVSYNATPVIMASGRELCYVLLAGVLGCYLTPVALLWGPSDEVCLASRVSPGLSLSICYSAILTKTNRISRIFNQGARIGRPACTSPRSQVAICMAMVILQVAVSGVWVVFEPPSVKELHISLHTVELSCAESAVSIMTSLAFNFLLILFCTVYAFKTRKIPENFNEAKYISFTMYSTCIVWLAFVPIHFGTKDHKVQTTAMGMCLEISATVVLGCLFAPKVYLVLFQPYKNVRQNHVQSGRGAPYSMKFGGASRSGRSQLAATGPPSTSDGDRHAALCSITSGPASGGASGGASGPPSTSSATATPGLQATTPATPDADSSGCGGGCGGCGGAAISTSTGIDEAKPAAAKTPPTSPPGATTAASRGILMQPGALATATGNGTAIASTPTDSVL